MHKIIDAYHVDATSVTASELISDARRRRWASIKCAVLIGTVDAIRISVANPLLRNALRSVPSFVLRASKLILFVAFSVI